jgi:hypothetical protein
MDKRGEIAFSTIVMVIIAVAVMIIILVFVIPSYANLFGKTEETVDAVVSDESLLELKCKNLCAEAERAEDPKASDFCILSKDECKNAVGVTCGDICA